MTNSSTKVGAFIGIVVVFMMVPPLVNWSKRTTQLPFKFNQQTLYNTDFIVKPFQRLVFNYGIRLSQKKVVVGKNQWLFIGDKFGYNVTRRIQGVSAQDNELIASSVERLKTWQKRFATSGVKEFRILLGPDKATVYPQYLPDWARAAEPTKSDALYEVLAANGMTSLVVDPRQTLIQARKKLAQPIYIPTDTHWSGLGGWLAFEQFGRVSQTAGAGPVQWPGRAMLNFEPAPWPDGDLARLLRIDLADKTQAYSFESPVETHSKKLSLPTRIIESMNEKQRMNFLSGAMQHHTPDALNNKRVLLIRDSFAKVLMPLFQRTFSDIADIHLRYYTHEVLVHLLDNYKPEIVYVVIVERDAVDQYLGFRQADQ